MIWDDPHDMSAPARSEVLARMLSALPGTPWADIEILSWRPGDDGLPVEYSFADSPFGAVLAANTPRGICYLAPAGNKPQDVLDDFHGRFRHSARVERESTLQKQAVGFLDGNRGDCLRFHLRGTPWQTEIWRRLIRVPCGKVISYATLGGGSRYARAAGTANGRNPIFWIVPCHRVVNTSGAFDRYFWGPEVKGQLLAMEFADNGEK